MTDEIRFTREGLMKAAQDLDNGEGAEDIFQDLLAHALASPISNTAPPPISGERWLNRRGFADSRTYSSVEIGALLDTFLAEMRANPTPPEGERPDRKDCSLCGTVRVPLNREGTKRGACTFSGCKDPLYDYNREHPAVPLVAFGAEPAAVPEGVSEELGAAKDGEVIAGTVVKSAAGESRPIDTNGEGPGASERSAQTAAYKEGKPMSGPDPAVSIVLSQGGNSGAHSLAMNLAPTVSTGVVTCKEVVASFSNGGKMYCERTLPCTVHGSTGVGAASPKLCYVSGDTAYFTTQELSKQWGDDWNDAPYEHNAGTPYEPHEGYDYKKDEPLPWTITHLKFEGPFEQPSGNHLNSPYSVQQINGGAVAWLHTDRWASKQVAIQAGVSIAEFKAKVAEAGGKIYELVCNHEGTDICSICEPSVTEDAGRGEARKWYACSQYEESADPPLCGMCGFSKDDHAKAEPTLPESETPPDWADEAAHKIAAYFSLRPLRPNEIATIIRTHGPAPAPRPPAEGPLLAPSDAPGWWDKVWALLEPWQEIWQADRSQFDKDYPQWMVDAATEIFAHDMCDAWSWHEYVKAATVILNRHFSSRSGAAPDFNTLHRVLTELEEVIGTIRDKQEPTGFDLSIAMSLERIGQMLKGIESGEPSTCWRVTCKTGDCKWYAVCREEHTEDNATRLLTGHITQYHGGNGMGVLVAPVRAERPGDKELK